MEWRTDLENAPRGDVKIVERKTSNGIYYTRAFPLKEFVFAITSDGHVVRTYWDPTDESWSGFHKDFPPLAWIAIPDHPLITKIEGAK